MFLKPGGNRNQNEAKYEQRQLNAPYNNAGDCTSTPPEPSIRGGDLIERAITDDNCKDREEERHTGKHTKKSEYQTDTNHSLKDRVWDWELSQRFAYPRPTREAFHLLTVRRYLLHRLFDGCLLRF